MNNKDKNILGAFLLARHSEELTNEEIKDVQQAIKRIWNNFDKAIEYIKEINNHNYSILVNGKETILDKKEILDTKMGEMQKLERILRGEDNEDR